jgi:hypothetical protein
MGFTSKQELDLGTAIQFQQQIPSHPNNKIRTVSHFLSRLDLELSLNSILKINSMHPNPALTII